MTDDAITRAARAQIALYDLGSRPGATAASVKKTMLKDGFTLDEIAKAAADMAGDKQ